MSGAAPACGVERGAENGRGERRLAGGIAIVLLTVLVAVARQVWRPEARPMGRDAEKAAATEWTAPRSPDVESRAQT